MWAMEGFYNAVSQNWSVVTLVTDSSLNQQNSMNEMAQDGSFSGLSPDVQHESSIASNGSEQIISQPEVDNRRTATSSNDAAALAMPRNVGEVSEELQQDGGNEESYSASIKPSIGPQYANKATKALANSVRNHDPLITGQIFMDAGARTGLVMGNYPKFWMTTTTHGFYRCLELRIQ